MGTPGVKRHLSESDGIEMGEKTSTWLLPAWRSRCPASNPMPASILARHWHPAACRSLGWLRLNSSAGSVEKLPPTHCKAYLVKTLTLQGSNYNGWHIFMILLWHGIAGFQAWYSMWLLGIAWHCVVFHSIVCYSMVFRGPVLYWF